MSNDFYNVTGSPSTSSAGSSSVVRSEFIAIQTGFEKLPALSGANNYFVAVNSGATALTSISASDARTLMGLTIGTNIQAWDADLDAIAALTSAANKIPYATGAQAWSMADFTAAGRAIVGAANAGAQMTALGISAFAQTILDDANAAAVRTTIGAAASGTSVGVHGQCQLQYVDGTHIKLMPFGGNLLTIAGADAAVPDAGVTIDASQVGAGSTLYYAYGTAAAGAVNDIELSTTVPAVSTATGNQGNKIKTGDETRTLVGYVYSATLGTYLVNAAWTGVRSYHNRLGLSTQSGLASSKSSSLGTYVKADSATDITFVTTGDELVSFWLVGAAFMSAFNTFGSISICVDGSLTAEDAQLLITPQGASGTEVMAISLVTPPRILSAGAHTASIIICGSGGGTLNIYGGAAPSSSSPTNRTSFGVTSSGVCS